jgi:hypothetical protein
MKQDPIVRRQGGGSVEIVQCRVSDLGVEPTMNPWSIVARDEDLEGILRHAPIRRRDGDGYLAIVIRRRGPIKCKRDRVERQPQRQGGGGIVDGPRGGRKRVLVDGPRIGLVDPGYEGELILDRIVESGCSRSEGEKGDEEDEDGVVEHLGVRELVLWWNVATFTIEA